MTRLLSVGEDSVSGFEQVIMLLMYAFTSSGEFFPRTGASFIHKSR